MRKFTYALFLLAGVVTIYSCQKTTVEPKPNLNEEILSTPNSSLNPTSTLCGTPTNIAVVNYDDIVAGSLRISNDASNYYITISESLVEYKIEEVRWIYGTEDHVKNSLLGIFACGSQLPLQSDQITVYNPGFDSVTLTLPFTAVSGDCIFFHAHIKVVKRDPVTGQEYFSAWIWSDGPMNADQNQCQRYFSYCKQTCQSKVCGPFRTYTQLEWGWKQHCKPADYLQANFAAAFPGGLTVGCSSKYKVKFTSAAAVKNYLPVLGLPKKLTASYTNPSPWSLMNILVGELTAVTLNVRFDSYDANFSSSDVLLGNMVIAKGPFQGKTINQFLAIANDVLGGCSTAYTPLQVTETAILINIGCKQWRENDDETGTTGEHDNNDCKFLTCPSDGGPRL